MRLRATMYLCTVLLLWDGCGTPGAPQPPSLNLAKPVGDLKAVRTINQVTLTWTVPTETTDGARFRHRGETKICSAINQAGIEQCAAIATLPTPANQKTASFTTDLPSGGTGPNDYTTYAVQVNNSNGRNAGLSNQVQVPMAAVSTLNGAARVQLTPDAIIATANVTPRNAAIEQVLELRRKEKGTTQESVVARRVLELPIPGEATNIELRDDTFAWEKTYEYRVAIVASVKVPNGETVTFDAALSPPQDLLTHDVFPPAVPSGLQAVFSGQLPGQKPAIDLTWNPDLDRDLAGYFVYRRREDDPVSAALKLNAQPVTAPAYRDIELRPGDTYLYSVSAIDERGNESKRSEETSESVPK